MDVDVDGCVIGFSVRLICFCFQVEGDVEVVHYFEVRLHGDLQAEFPEDVNEVFSGSVGSTSGGLSQRSKAIISIESNTGCVDFVFEL